MSFKKLVRDSKTTDKDVKNRVILELSSMFPISGNLYRIDAKNFSVDSSEPSFSDIKKAVSNGGSVYSPVKADIYLYRKSDGKLIDKKRRVIMSIPSFTKKDSFIIDGNSYVVPNQQRLKPGVYTSIKRNGDVQTSFNLSKGRNFNIKLSENGVFKIGIGSRNLSLYSILKDLGVPDSEMERYWGKDLLSVNKKSYSTEDSKKFTNAYFYSKGDKSENIDIKDALSTSRIDPDIAKETIGVSKESVDSVALLKASEKLLKVYNGEEKGDDKDSLVFKKIVPPEDMIGESFQKLSKDTVNKIKFKLNSPDVEKIDDVLGSGGQLFTKTIKNFLTSSKISRLGEEYNPLMMLSTKHILTPMGEGGVGDTRALDLNTKAVHPSHMGFIDPVVSPEGASVGITLAVTDNAYVDDKGNPAMSVVNAKTGKKEVHTIKYLYGKKVAYPFSEERAKKDGIHVRHGSVDKKAKGIGDVDYFIEDDSDLHAPSLNSVPLVNSSDANRTNMAQKHTQQALPLEHREAPIVSVKDHGDDSTKVIAEKTKSALFSPIEGTVTRITKNKIEISGNNGDRISVDMADDLPLARKTYLSHTPSVSVGDKVKKGSLVADSNFTKDGKLSLGRNLRTAWLSRDGNRNDGVVISETAAKELTSLHMYKEIVETPPGTVLDKKKFIFMFPDVASKWGAENYDEHGVIKKGSKLRYRQPIVLKLVEADRNEIKGKLGKIISKPYKAVLDTWHHQEDGDVVSVERGAGTIRVSAKIKSPAKVGDKLSARQGNKGVITKILHDSEMPRNKDGESVHVLMTSAGVISRTNGGSLIEAGLGKVGDKTNKTYALGHYEKGDNLEFANKEAKNNAVNLKEELINPETNKPFPQKIFVGKPYIMKLFKDSESGMSSVGVGATDINEQPIKGGTESASAISNLEVNALLAHGAKDFLREVKHIKGQKNDDYFESFENGRILPPASENFATNKFKAYLNQANIDLKEDRENGTIELLPMTDRDVLKLSSGAIKNPDTVSAKNMKPVKGGLFDESIFGGTEGSRYGHINLGTKIPNPMFKDTIASLTGTTVQKLDEDISKNGSVKIKSTISNIDINKKIKEIKNKIDSSKNPKSITSESKLLKFLEKTKNSGKKLSDVLLISKVPVMPPKYRPIAIDSSGDVSVNDMNYHYKDIHDISTAITTSNNLSKKTKVDLESDLYKSVGAMFGVDKTPNKKLENKNVKGVLGILSGDTPKQSYVHKTMLRSKQFMSGRGVIKPSSGSTSIDEIEIPEKMAINMFEPHIKRELAMSGRSPAEAQKLIDEKDPIVTKILKEKAKEIPVAYNRAPTLWRHNIVGGYAKITKGNTIGTNPLVERSLNSDYDGDAIGVHVPITDAAAKDIKDKMMPSKMLFTEEKNSSSPDVLFIPDQDSMLGVYKSSNRSSRKSIHVKDINELKRRVDSGEINYNDRVVIG